MADAYVDHSKGAALAINYLFTNASATVTPASDPTGELAVGNYIKSDYAGSDIQWYKVTAVAAGSVTISPAFQQATTTSTTAKKNNGVGSLADAYAHHSQATADSVRSPGDIIYTRANLTYTYKSLHIFCDENGSLALPITILGCSSVIDPWEDASDVMPIVSIPSAHSIYLDSKSFWKCKNIEMKNNTGSYGAINSAGNSYGLILEDVKFTNNVIGFKSSVAGTSIINGVFSGNTTHISAGAPVFLSDVTIDGGTKGISGGGLVEAENCSIGQTTPLTTDVELVDNIVTFRRCKLDIAKVSVLGTKGCFYSEDHNQAVGDHKSKYYHGMIERETTEVRVGGANNSIKVTPNANNHTDWPWLIAVWSEEAVAASAQTRGIYIEVTGINSTYPTAAQLWFEAESFSAASGTAKQINKSAAVLSANSTWTWFPVTFTPGQAGKVRYRVYLAMPTEGATQDVYYVDNQLRDAS